MDKTYRMSGDEGHHFRCLTRQERAERNRDKKGNGKKNKAIAKLKRISKWRSKKH